MKVLKVIGLLLLGAAAGAVGIAVYIFRASPQW
jgi:hypothetical protein